MSAPHTPRQNHLLAALPAADFERLQLLGLSPPFSSSRAL